MREKIEKVIKEQGLYLGCYNSKLDNLSQAAFRKLKEEIKYADTGDFVLPIQRVPHVIEMCIVDNEVDLDVKTLPQYENTYGYSFYDKQ